MTRVKIKLIPKNQGFHVTLYHGDSSQDGFLPHMPPVLNQTFKGWQGTYRQLEGVRSHFRIINPSVTCRSKDEGRRYVSEVESLFNQWLNTADRRWQEIRDALIYIFGEFGGKERLLSILLDTDTIELSRLPWQEWDLLKKRSFQTELALRVRERFGNSIKPVVPQDKVRILVLVGCTESLDISQDLAIIQELEDTRNAEVTLLRQPGREDLQNALRDQLYHIFVYIGHSRSNENGNIGWLRLNENESISIQDFNLAFQRAIDEGLQLAIFNSCDGLGLAHQLAELNLPRSVVMREPIPDKAAAAFLQHFLRAFSQGESLFAAMHEARGRLEQTQSEYPGVMWLPVLCTRESALKQALTWTSMLTTGEASSSLAEKIPPPTIQPKIRKWLLGGAGIAGLVAATIWLLVSGPSPLNKTFKDIDIPAGTWRYGGSTTWAPIRSGVDSQILQVHPDFNLVYTSHPTRPDGSGTGIIMLLNEQLSFSQSSRPLSDEEYAKADLRGFTLKQVPVGIDAIAIAVHPTLEVDSLSIRQIEGIYAGRITNWQELGGPNLPITPYSRPADAGGTPEFFVDNVLSGQSFGDPVQIVHDTTTGLRQVIENPGGIYYASAPEIVPQCRIKPLPIRRSNAQLVPPYEGQRVPPAQCPNRRNQVNTEAIQTGEYPLTRRLFVIIKQKGRDGIAGQAYADLLLTDEGQELIREIGFVPLR